MLILAAGSLKVLNIDQTNKFLSLARVGTSANDDLVIILNFYPNSISNYSFPILQKANWQLILNSDSAVYGGQNTMDSEIFVEGRIPENFHGDALTLKNLSAYSGLIFKIN